MIGTCFLSSKVYKTTQKIKCTRTSVINIKFGKVDLVTDYYLDTGEKFKPAWGVTETESVETVVEEKIPDTSKFIGNTGTLVFHSSDCKYSKSKKCTADFNTKEEAIQDGYKPCGTCKP